MSVARSLCCKRHGSVQMRKPAQLYNVPTLVGVLGLQALAAEGAAAASDAQRRSASAAPVDGRRQPPPYATPPHQRHKAINKC